MKKHLLSFSLLIAGLMLNAQSTRMSLFEEFTGETCPPCAATNPGLNILLASPTNTPKVIALKWQVPIPSAPTNTWSLYQTDKAEIDWRYRSISAGGFGYNNPGGITSAPNGKLDGQNPVVFGASSDHPANLNSGVIATAQSYTTPFSIAMTRNWSSSGSAVNLTITVTASAAFTSVGNLVLRTCMVERLINFSVQPGTNGEKDFEDVVIKSFPSIQTGIALPSSWTNGQSQTFTLSCPIPSYTRKITEIAMVSFIQDDGDRKVWQAARADRQGVPNDAEAISATVPSFTCGNTISPSVIIKNSGITTITDMTITPAIDGAAATPVVWTGNLAMGATVSVPVGVLTSSVGGGHVFSYTITNVSGTDFYSMNNSAKTSFYMVAGYQGTPVSEGFFGTAFPPPAWGSVNANNGPSWSRVSNVGAYAILPLGSMKYDFFTNTSIGDADEMLLPPMNLAGANTPTLTFDIAKAVRANENDMLEVMVSADCGVTWVTVYSKAGTNLATWPSPITSAYLPVTAAEWRTEEVSLTGFNLANVLVKFVATNDHGNNMFIDNVNLSQTEPVGIHQYGYVNYRVELYPNPSKGETTVMINTLKPTSAKVRVINSMGQLVYESSAELVNGDNKVSFDASKFAKGVYSVSVESVYGKVVKKLTVAD
ncbi:MAG TPA: choice-of-anchor J domain-containing protein [Bacteroidia bacterium]|nr:choice-of-anchor J domain-containing protein [Bacteroidia bacterium]